MAAVTSMVHPALRRVETQQLSEHRDLKALKKVCESWKEILGERLAYARENKENSLESREIFANDRATFTSYSEVLTYIKGSISKQHEKVIIVSKKDGIIDGICACTFDPIKNQYYIDGLATAPWNIKMAAGVEPEHETLKRGKIGTSLMKSLYEIAQAKKIEKIVTTPLQSAFSFYENLGMGFDRSSMMFSFIVSDALPLKLL